MDVGIKKKKERDKRSISNKERRWYCLVHFKYIYQEQIIAAVQKELKDKGPFSFPELCEVTLFTEYIIVCFEYIIVYFVFTSTYVPLGMIKEC